MERRQERKESGIKRSSEEGKESAICDAVFLSLELGRRQYGRETDQDEESERSSSTVFDRRDEWASDCGLFPDRQVGGKPAYQASERAWLELGQS
jgi:hypothetical protein